MGQRRRAVTILELLVTLGILTLIAAILLPVLSAARHRGRLMACVAQLRQLGQAMQMYRQDHGAYPPAFSGWVKGLSPHVKEPRLFFCPNYKGDPPGISMLASYRYAADGNRSRDDGAELGPRSIIMDCREHARRQSFPAGVPGQVRPAPYEGRFVLLRNDGAVEIVPAERVKEAIRKGPPGEPWFGATTGVLQFPE